MKTNIKKSGNSFILYIPKPFALKTHISNGTVVDISVEKGKIIINPLSDISEKESDLDSLLSKITEQNIHKEVFTGEPIGNEIW
ncbi:MAG: AbrB/MazE/SpoVT family DNA-binding domain-containing protein [bacterium]